VGESQHRLAMGPMWPVVADESTGNSVSWLGLKEGSPRCGGRPAWLNQAMESD